LVFYIKALYISKHFDQFCADLYDYIKHYKREINLFEKDQAYIDKQIRQLKESFQALVDSPEFSSIFLYFQIGNKE